MGHSLAAGIRQVAAQWAFACVALADMPFIEPRTLQELWRSFQTGPADCIVQPEFQGKPGHPVIFPRACFSFLVQLTGDHGARALLQDNSRMLIQVEVADQGVIKDVDRPPDS
jgi:CTP:molybdopterin cytidylyltransferase MocA